MTAAAAVRGVPSTGRPDPLGTNAKSIHAGGGVEAERDRRESGIEGLRRRFGLLRVAQQLLWSPDVVSVKEQHRTVWCHRASQSTQGGASVFRALDGARARLGGVVTCGQVWTCPVCAAKVAETRRRELSRAMTQHQADGGHAYLLTFTFPHSKADRLADLLTALADARQRFQNGRTWKAWCTTAGRVGAVTSMEVTFGHNGWHPHLHMLVFTQPRAFGEGRPDDATGDLHSPLIDAFAGLWVDALQRVGLVDRAQLGDAMKYAFNVRGGSKAAEYIAKWGRDEAWGASSELTKAHAKTGRRRLGGAWHVTPFQLLALVDDGDDSLMGAWHEYAAGMKGRRMLTWTPGLKRHFDVVDLDDDDLAAEGVAPAPEEARVGALSHDQLRAVVACAALGDLLAFVARSCAPDGGQQQIDAWIATRCPRARLADGGALRRWNFGGGFTDMEPAAPPDMSVYA